MNRYGFILGLMLASTLPLFSQDDTHSSPETPLVQPEPEIITVQIPGLPESARPLEMVFIQPGTFWMGTKDDEAELFSGPEGTIWRKSHKVIEEKPQRSVEIKQGFYLGRYEVTQAQWQAIMGFNPSLTPGQVNAPVETVTWNDCQAFIQKLNRLELGTFRLPSEVEWEYACRAGTATRYYWSDDPDSALIGDYAWYHLNSQSSGPKEVGSKLPNPWGLFDMAGNVEEWCADGYTPGTKNDTANPNAHYRILRGGGWRFRAWFCRSSYRSYGLPDLRHAALGLRLAREVN